MIPEIIFEGFSFSAEKGDGRDELMKYIFAAVKK